ncbi:hypothetical protein HGM15179_015933 [Zosterops borbonicus]|uniref:Uncharacterized protein n=1 Tax=Zosterops borbonicus TaxID=364589 RepID=A0A8K1G3I3_9PASS|nr:hypothetical protein HGM15179_015933 [Zosterops borbonicus]
MRKEDKDDEDEENDEDDEEEDPIIGKRGPQCSPESHQERAQPCVTAQWEIQMRKEDKDDEDEENDEDDEEEDPIIGKRGPQCSPGGASPCCPSALPNGSEESHIRSVPSPVSQPGVKFQMRNEDNEDEDNEDEENDEDDDEEDPIIGKRGPQCSPGLSVTFQGAQRDVLDSDRGAALGTSNPESLEHSAHGSAAPPEPEHKSQNSKSWNLGGSEVWNSRVRNEEDEEDEEDDEDDEGEDEEEDDEDLIVPLMRGHQECAQPCVIARCEIPDEK